MRVMRERERESVVQEKGRVGTACLGKPPKRRPKQEKRKSQMMRQF
jgi:hypothetical protein